MTTYFKSDKVRVFPSAYRGTDTNNKMYNPESRLQTEFNTTLKKYLVDTDGFVIEYKDNHIKFVLKGYYFDIDISDIAIADRSYLAVKLILDTLHTATDIYDYTEIALHTDEVTNFVGLVVYGSSSTAEERKNADFVLLENNNVPESSKFKYNSDSIVINNRKLTDLFEANGYIKNATNADKAAKADNATNATNADNATTSKNVSSTINSKNISDIFETNGTTAKKATDAENAKKVTDTIGNFAISTIFEAGTAKVKYATTADKLASGVGAADKPVYVDKNGVVRVCTSINVPGSITDAGNVTSSINGLALTEIFNYDSQGITRYVKNALVADVATAATNAVTANKVKEPLTLNLNGADTIFNGSEAQNLSFYAPTYIGTSNQVLTAYKATGSDKTVLVWASEVEKAKLATNADYLQYTSLSDSKTKRILWNPAASIDISTEGGDAGLVVFGGSTSTSNDRYLYAKAFKAIDVGSLLNRTSSNITDKSLYYIQDIEFEDNQTYIATLRSNNNGNALLEPTHTDSITVGNATNATNTTLTTTSFKSATQSTSSSNIYQLSLSDLNITGNEDNGIFIYVKAFDSSTPRSPISYDIGLIDISWIVENRGRSINKLLRVVNAVNFPYVEISATNSTSMLEFKFKNMDGDSTQSPLSITSVQLKRVY